MKKGYTYIMTNKKEGTLYVGVTSNLEKRVLEHKKKIEGFTKKYNLTKLVWYQEFPTIKEAIEYEKKLKGGRRSKKVEHIEKMNAMRNDLSVDWLSY